MIKFIVSVAVPLLAGYIGSLVTMPAIPTWYDWLIKPVLNPPSFVFAPVWTALYILMGVAFFLIWKSSERAQDKTRAMGLYLFQLVVNVIWSAAFFGLQSPLFGLIIIAILWVSIVATIVAFHKISKPAAYLLLPYIAWVSFASYLTTAIWWLN